MTVLSPPIHVELSFGYPLVPLSAFFDIFDFFDVVEISGIMKVEDIMLTDVRGVGWGEESLWTSKVC